MNINPQQNRILHRLLTDTRMMDNKADLVFSFSGQRTSSSKELTANEAAQLIQYLGTLPNIKTQCNVMRRKIIAKAHKMRWEIAGKADMDRIDNWCITKGGFKKPLNDHNYDELVQLVTQFNQMYKKFVASF